MTGGELGTGIGTLSAVGMLIFHLAYRKSTNGKAEINRQRIEGICKTQEGQETRLRQVEVWQGAANARLGNIEGNLDVMVGKIDRLLER